MLKAGCAGYGGGMSSAKAALESDTRVLAFEAGRKHGIRVNAISAGPLGSRAAKAIGFIDDMIKCAASQREIYGGVRGVHHLTLQSNQGRQLSRSPSLSLPGLETAAVQAACHAWHAAGCKRWLHCVGSTLACSCCTAPTTVCSRLSSRGCNQSPRVHPLSQPGPAGMAFLLSYLLTHKRAAPAPVPLQECAGPEEAARAHLCSMLALRGPHDQGLAHTSPCLCRYSYENAPIQKELHAHEVGAAAAFLLSPLASAITGTVLHVDNGLSSMGLALDSRALDRQKEPAAAAA